jgi:hypothetical protein
MGQVILKSMTDFFRDGGPVLTGSIAYFFLMSFVPFCLLLVSVFGYILGENREFFRFFTARLLRFFPAATAEISRQLTALVVYRQIGIFTLALYLFFSYQLYMALEAATRAIFTQKESRSLTASVVFSFFVITMIAVLILASFAATSVVQLVGALLRVFPSLKFVIPVLLVLFVATVLYAFLPVKRASFPTPSGEGSLLRSSSKRHGMSSRCTSSTRPRSTARSMGRCQRSSYCFCGSFIRRPYSSSAPRWCGTLRIRPDTSGRTPAAALSEL